MIRKIVLTKTGRGDIFYRVTIPKNFVEIMDWNKSKTLFINSTNKEIILSKNKRTNNKVTLTKAITKKKGRKQHHSYSFIIPKLIVKKLKITKKNKVKINLKDQDLVLRIK